MDYTEDDVVQMHFHVRSAYNYDRDKASIDSGLECLDATRAKQEFAEEVDINTIVKRFGLTGELPQNVAVPQYGDFEDVMDYKSAMDAVVKANVEFMSLPATLRARFHNDPQELIEFMAIDDNRDEAVKLGLVPKKEAPVEPAGVAAAPAAA